MRTILLALCLAAVGMPSAAFAAGVRKPSGVVKATSTTQVAKAKKSRGGASVGGIHPMVGSGDY